MPPKPRLDDAPAPAARVVAVVTAPAGPRRRAGISFGKAPIHLTDAELDENRRIALMADPLLVIRIDPPPAPTDGAAPE